MFFLFRPWFRYKKNINQNEPKKHRFPSCHGEHKISYKDFLPFSVMYGEKSIKIYWSPFCITYFFVPFVEPEVRLGSENKSFLSFDMLYYGKFSFFYMDNGFITIVERLRFHDFKSIVSIALVFKPDFRGCFLGWENWISDPIMINYSRNPISKTCPPTHSLNFHPFYIQIKNFNEFYGTHFKWKLIRTKTLGKKNRKNFVQNVFNWKTYPLLFHSEKPHFLKIYILSIFYLHIIKI